MGEAVAGDETLDDLAGGRLRVLQKAKGYRFSLDAILLAHFVRLCPEERVLEMGTGSGVIALLLANRWAGVHITGLDVQTGMVEMARKSVMINGLEERIEIREGDVRDIKNLFPDSCCDAVVANPPYRRKESGRLNPQREKALARHEIMGTAGDFLRAAAHVLKPAGRVFFIYPATRLGELLCGLREFRLEPKRLRMVHSHAAGVGKFALLEGLKEGGEELHVLPPLFIYEATGGYTEEMGGIFRELSSDGHGAG